MRDNRHNLSHWMLGKRDLKGRLLSDREREEIRDARFMTLIMNEPENPIWKYFTQKVDQELKTLMGMDSFNAWMDEMTLKYPDPEVMTWQEIYLMAKEKLDAERKSHDGSEK